MMRKCIIAIGLFAILAQLCLGGLPPATTLQAQEADNSGKISGLLALQVEAKLNATQASSLQVVPEISSESERVDILEASGVRLEDLNMQRIFIHLPQEPTKAQIAELEALGISPYIDSWIPPVGSHPTGFLLADMPVDKLGALAGIDYVASLDTAERALEPLNDLAVQKINADDVWNALSPGYDGTGVTIAVLDSGLDVSHNDIPTPIASMDYDDYPILDITIANMVDGHGTHVTGSALGRGTQSGGVYKGSAPDADLVFLKIGGDTTSSSTVAAMVNAIKDAVDIYNADIITMSYGGWSDHHDGSGETSQAVDYAVSQGAVVFISAGNEATRDEHFSGSVPANSSTGFIQLNVTGVGTSNTALAYNLVWFDGTGTSNDLGLEYYDSNDPSATPLALDTTPTQTESTKGTESEYSAHANYVGDGNYYLKVKNNSANLQFFHI